MNFLALQNQTELCKRCVIYIYILLQTFYMNEGIMNKNGPLPVQCLYLLLCATLFTLCSKITLCILWSSYVHMYVVVCTYIPFFHQHYRLISDVPCMATFFLERTHPSLLLHQPVLEHKADHSFIINSLHIKTLQLHIMKYTAVNIPLFLFINQVNIFQVCEMFLTLDFKE